MDKTSAILPSETANAIPGRYKIGNQRLRQPQPHAVLLVSFASPALIDGQPTRPGLS